MNEFNREQTLEGMAHEVHEMALQKGWWAGLTESARLDLLCDWLIEEVEELREAYHARGWEAWATTDAEGHEKPEGVGSEAADIYLIVGDIMRQGQIDLTSAARLKLDYNHVRRYRRDAQGNKIEAQP